MALLFCDNFENWQSTSINNPGPWLRATGVWGIGTGSNVNSNIAGVFQTTDGGAGFLETGFPEKETLVVNCRVSFGQTVSTIGNRTICILYSNGSAQCSLVHKSNGHLAIFRGETTAELGQSINSFSINSAVFLDIEWKVTVHNTTGVIELRVNGAVEIASTGSLNTRASTLNSANSITIGKVINSPGLSHPLFKHFILMDTTGSTMNDFIGPVAITSLRPNEDGHYDDWTPNTGSRFAAVNQAITDGDTTYVTANTATDKVSFKLGNLPAGVTDVFGVFAQAQIKREAETTRIARMFLRSGVDDEPIGTAQGIGPTYAFRNAAVTVSPFTTNAFDVAEINDIELGMEITT
jgi:hypothetical protein